MVYLLFEDWIVFGAFMCISIGVGAFYAIKSWRKSPIVENGKSDDNQQTASDEYLMGGRNMPILPTALSLLTTFLSGITIFGTPAELFQRGLLWWLYYVMGAFAFPISAYFFVPIFYRLGATSVYEYFEHRFQSKFLRRLTALIFIVNTIFYMGVVVYAPAVALAGVTELGTWPMILLVGIAGTMYTSVGGLKAVVWTDTLQAGVMYAGLGLLIVKGLIDAGGFTRVWEVAIDGKRVADLKYLSPDPAQFSSVWIASLGGFSYFLSFYGLNQMAIQRYCSLPTMKHARWMVAITCPLFIVLGGMACFMGLIVLAYFYNCNPLETKSIDSQDKLVIWFAVKILKPYPGTLGLFIACIFAATLSTLSGGINSLSAVFYEDFIKPFYRLTDRKATLLNKTSALVFGILGTAMAFAGGPLGGIIKASIGLMGTLGGPVMGLFILGIFCTRSSTKAATIAFIISAIFSCTLWIWNYIDDPFKGNYLPTNTTVEGCRGIFDGNITLRPQITAYNPHYGDPKVFYLARISSYILPFVGMVMVILIAYPLSYIPGLKAQEEAFAFDRTYSLTFTGRKARYAKKL